MSTNFNINPEMKLQTIVDITPANQQISHFNRIMGIGSCFADNIGNYMKYYGFKLHQNPYGIIYNPISISQCIKQIINHKIYTIEDLIFFNGLYHSLDHHGSFNNADSEAGLNKINWGINKANQFWQKTDVLIITWGTAVIYEYNEQDRIVANCHKIPAQKFTIRILSTDEILDEYIPLLDNLLAQNPQLHILFTLSPIRHLRDGAVPNTISKSILRTAMYELENRYTQITYFPAYELLMDELRDYRFYNEDMLHPTEQAIRYIWGKFSYTYFSQPTLEIVQQIGELKTQLSHRSLFPNSEEDQKRKYQLEQRIEEFLSKNTQIDTRIFRAS